MSGVYPSEVHGTIQDADGNGVSDVGEEEKPRCVSQEAEVSRQARDTTSQDAVPRFLANSDDLEACRGLSSRSGHGVSSSPAEAGNYAQTSFKSLDTSAIIEEVNIYPHEVYRVFLTTPERERQ